MKTLGGRRGAALSVKGPDGVPAGEAAATAGVVVSVSAAGGAVPTLTPGRGNRGGGGIGGAAGCGNNNNNLGSSITSNNNNNNSSSAGWNSLRAAGRVCSGESACVAGGRERATVALVVAVVVVGVVF